MNINNFGKAENKDYSFNINIDFTTKTELTPRMIEVSEAFGLGVSEEKHFVIYKDFNIGFNQCDVVFITGDSGGGKSLLLKELNNHQDIIHKINLDDIQPDPEEVIIESVGKTLEEGIRILSLMGLNDAFIFLRKYKELSDGQKYRYRLAKALSMKPDFLFIDEFCANLDRSTAQVISYNLQRTARREKMCLIVATTHQDIVFDLNADVVIDKKFMDEVSVTYKDVEKREISFYDQIYIEEGTIADYKKLAKYHYKNTSHNFPYSKIYVAKRHEELVGVAVYSPPFLQTKGRSIYFDKKYSHMTKEVVADINKLFIRRSRSIISPKYRACGLGKMLAMESMLKIKDKKYIEAINVMGKYTPVNKQIGMTEVTIGEETDGPTIKLDKWMKEKGLKVEEIHNPKYFDLFISSMTDEDRLTLVRLTGKVLHHPKVGLSSKDGRRAEVVAQEKRYAKTTFEDVYEELLVTIPKLYSGVTLYYVWENPNYKEPVKQGLGAYLK